MQSSLIGWGATMGEVADNGAQPAVPGHTHNSISACSSL
jgi:hypothetical protein